MIKFSIKRIKIPLFFIGDTLASNSNPIKYFSKYVKLKWIYYRVECGRMAFDDGSGSYNWMPDDRILFYKNQFNPQFS